MIKLDTTLLQSVVSPDALAAQQEAVSRIVTSLHQGTCTGHEWLGWRDLPLQDHLEEQHRVEDYAAEIQDQADVLIVVGIGGSYLGSMAAISGLTPFFGGSNKGPEILFFGHHLSADYAAELLRHLEGKRYYINVISKSGTTTEPGIAFRLLLDHLSRQVTPQQRKRRIIATTDAQKGALHDLASAAGYRSFVIPGDVGGRFSVLTPVGLLPMAVAGIDIDQLLAGARSMARHCKSHQDLAENDVLKYAAARHLLYQAGKYVEVLAYWHPALAYVAEWWKQLFGESEGKDGKGIWPASVGLTTDLHSLGQYIQDGRRMIFETFLQVDRNLHPQTIPALEGDPDELGYLASRDLAEANFQALQGTALAHHQGGTPSMTLHMGERDAYHFGELFYFFEFAVAVSGLLLGVNPFDQPGVEAYKKNMFALLGKPGSESQAELLAKQMKQLGINA